MGPIEEAAKREGTVTVYSSFNIDEFDKIYPLFQDRYGIKVEHIRATGETILQRLVTEARAGRVVADLYETNSFEVFNAIQENLLEAWMPPNAAVFPDDLKDDQGFWVSTRQNIDGIAWNTNLVQPNEAPQSYEDMTDPRWRGRMLVERDDTEMFVGLIQGKFGGDMARARQWLEGVAANQPQLNRGHTETTELLVAGGGAVFLGVYAHRVETMKARRAPIEWMQTEGVQLLQAGGITRGAPHPNAAKLFWNWFVGEEAQQAISAVGRIPSRPGVALEAPLKPVGMRFYAVRPEYARIADQAVEMWRQVFGQRQ